MTACLRVFHNTNEYRSYSPSVPIKANVFFDYTLDPHSPCKAAIPALNINISATVLRSTGTVYDTMLSLIRHETVASICRRTTQFHLQKAINYIRHLQQRRSTIDVVDDEKNKKKKQKNNWRTTRRWINITEESVTLESAISSSKSYCQPNSMTSR